MRVKNKGQCTATIKHTRENFPTTTS